MINKIKNKIKKLICYTVHNYEFIFKAGANSYYQCKYCNKRIYTPDGYGYSPVDKKWLNEKTNRSTK